MFQIALPVKGLIHVQFAVVVSMLYRLVGLVRANSVWTLIAKHAIQRRKMQLYKAVAKFVNKISP